MLSIVPLSKENIDEALFILNEHYGKDQDSAVNFRTWLPASLPDSVEGMKLQDEKHIDYLQYWVAVDIDKNLVVGVTGIFTKDDQPDLAWLGWTSVLDQGVIENLEDLLVEFVSNVAYCMGKSRLADFVDDGEEDVFLRDMLFRNGFVLSAIEEKSEAPDGSVHFIKDLSAMLSHRQNTGNSPPPDNRPKEQGPIAVSSGMGEVNQIVRAYKEGGLARLAYAKIGVMLQGAANKIAGDAWQQGQQAHPDCNNPYKEKP